MTTLTSFNLTAAMDRKTLRKVRKKFVKRNYYYYGENTNTDKSYEPSISIRIDDDRETAPATVEITVDIERLSTEMDIPGLLEPALENGYHLVEIIRKKYGELSNILPFDRFYLSELTYTSWINFPDKELTGEYIHLLKRSIFQNDSAIFGTGEFETDPDRDMVISYSILPDHDITFYRQIDNGLSDASTLVVRIRDHNIKSIDQKLISSSNLNKPVDEQLSFFIMTYMDYMTDILSPEFPKSPYTKKDSMIKSILAALDKKNIPQARSQEVIELITNASEDVNVYTWLWDNNMLFATDGTPSLWSDLIRNRVQLICIRDGFDRTDEFPDILTLVENGVYDPDTANSTVELPIDCNPNHLK